MDKKPKLQTTFIPPSSGGNIIGGNITTGHTYTVTSAAVNPIWTVNAQNSVYAPGGIYTTGVGGNTLPNMRTSVSQNAITFFSNVNAPIVSLKNDGTVEWTKEIEIDEAAKSFAASMIIGAELSIGITQFVKQQMRDSVFNDLIEIANQKGTLTSEDLTYLLQAAKIMEKLKGPKE
jgi:hypothetical protein